MFGTEKVISPKNSEGWMVGVWDSLNLDRSKLFGSLCCNPNKIQTNDIVGGVIYFCRQKYLERDGSSCRERNGNALLGDKGSCIALLGDKGSCRIAL